MDITEIKAAVEQDPALKDQILSVVSDGRIIRTKEEDQQFLDSHVNAVVDERVQKALQSRVDDEFGKALTKIDQEIKAITGVEKQPNEKTTAYAKRALEERRTGGDPITKERVKQLEQLLESSKAENEQKLRDYEQKLFTSELNYQLNAELEKANIAVPVHLKTEEEKQRYINQQKQLIRQGFLSSYQPKKDEAGNLVFYKGEQPMLSTKDGKAKSAGELISEEYAPWFVPQGVQQTGTGTGAATGAVPPAGGFKTTEDVHKHLAAQGIDAGQPQYLQEFQRLTAEHKLSV